MTLYVDSSVWLAVVLPKPRTKVSLALLAGDEDLAASDWVWTEIASAVGIKARRGDVRRSQADQIVTRCRDLLSWHADLLPVTSYDCRVATGYVERTTLRAADALHLAIAGRFEVPVVTADRGMAQAGQALGLGTRLLA